MNLVNIYCKANHRVISILVVMLYSFTHSVRPILPTIAYNKISDLKVYHCIQAH